MPLILDNEQGYWWSPRATSAEYAAAVTAYCNTPGNYDTRVNVLTRADNIYFRGPYFTGFDVSRPIPANHVQALADGRNIPLGDLAYNLAYGNVSAFALNDDARNTFDYHGISIHHQPTIQATPRAAASPLANGRPSGWEVVLIHELDTYFASYLEWPDRHTLVGHRLGELRSNGLTPANWERLPELRRALERHNLPLRVDPRTAKWVVDDRAYSSLQSRSGRSQVAEASAYQSTAHAGARRDRDSSESPSPTRQARQLSHGAAR